MSINELVQYSHSLYSKKQGQCSDCPNKEQGSCTSTNCSSCFQNMFFGNGSRTFNCVCSTYSYVCRYIFQYSSEVLHLFRVLKRWFKDESGIRINDLNVMSIGCGPCSELFAVDSILKEIGYTGNVTYDGFDTNDIWTDVQNKVKNILPYNVNIINQDCFDYLKSTPHYTYPNILIINYLLSDILKRGDLSSFISEMTEHIIDKMPPRSMIIINDINHYDVRNYYKEIISKSNSNNIISQATLGFIINYEKNKKDMRAYEYSYNGIFSPFKEAVIRFLVSMYATKTSCTSAQLVVIKKSDKQ
ncbi:hypothetical protein [Parabacteroides faecis]|uniref:Class I SAM-dependent methyltransferase n=1 Tax=Parabacteroides faecis TaxID=1217282 RepID=A0ABR6KSC8_9BACT|nr:MULTISPECIES: hypothetical protein [Parabacteroides]MBB4623802.1 hypothetical protein [Parabacteroides faecis]